MSLKFNPTTGKLDVVRSLASLDTRYLQPTDTMFIGTTEHVLTVIFSFATNIILVRTGIISDSE